MRLLLTLLGNGIKDLRARLETEISQIDDNLAPSESKKFDYLENLSHEELESLIKQKVFI